MNGQDGHSAEKDAPDFVCCVIGCDAEATVLSSLNEDYFCDEHDPDAEKEARVCRDCAYVGYHCGQCGCCSEGGDRA